MSNMRGISFVTTSSRLSATSMLWFFLFFPLAIFGGKFNDGLSQFVVKYFVLKNIKMMTVFYCGTQDDIIFHATLNGIYTNVIQITDVGDEKLFDLFLDQQLVGIFIDMRCKNSLFILEKASAERLFVSRFSWLILMENLYSLNDLQKAATHATPEFLNITEYLELGNSEMKYGYRMRELNSKVNSELLMHLNESQIIQTPVKADSRLFPYVSLPVVYSSDVTLVVPSYQGFFLYELYRKTQYSKLIVNQTGFVKFQASQIIDLYLPDVNSSAQIRRKGLNQSLLRAGVALLFYDYIGRSEDHPTLHVDIWAQMNIILWQTMEQDLNFRMVIKLYDDYGFEVSDGVFSGLTAAAHRNEVDITTGLVLRNDRLKALDFIDASIQVELGILFRQPNLAAVTNIFVLPFSKEAWLACGILIIFVSGFIWYQLIMERKIEPRLPKSTYGDVLFTIFRLATQQGYMISIITFSTKLSFFILLVSSLLLFTSYAATIVALFQSPSDYIKSVADLVESNLGVGVENVPYLRKNIEEDTRPTVIALKNKKLIPKGKQVFMNTSAAITKVHREMFAFCGEFSTGYEIISQTFTEKEKCGLKKIVMYLNINGPGIAKYSPLKEIFSERRFWHREVGLVKRVTKRFVHPPPKCEARRGGFTTVTILDIKPLLLFLIYSIVTSICILLCEIIMKKFQPVLTVKRINWIRKVK